MTDGVGPVSGATVRALSAVNGVEVATGSTGTDGTWSLPGLPTGSYLVRFSSPGQTTRFAGSVDVVADTVTTGVDVALAPESTITGRITDGTRGVTGVAIVATSPDDAWTPVATATSGPDGSFVLHSLGAAPVEVHAIDSTGRLAPALIGSFTPPPEASLDAGIFALHGTDCAAVPSGSNQAGADLAGARLANCDLSAADLSGADLSGADLSGSNLADVNIAGANLDGADLTNTSLVGVRSGGVAGTVVAIPAGWHQSDGFLIGPGADLVGADLSGTDLTGQDFAWVNLTGANLTSSTVTGVDLEGATLAGATLGGVRSGGIVGTPATLPTPYVLANGYLLGPEVDLSCEGCSPEDLTHLDLSGIDLHGANLTNASFVGSNLTGADLRDTVGVRDLHQATITGAKIDGADFGYVLTDGLTSGGLVGTPAHLMPSARLLSGYLVAPLVNLTGAGLADLDLSGMNLNGTNFSGADLSGADLSDTRLGSSMLGTATLTGVRSGGITLTPASLPGGWKLVNGYLLGAGVDVSGVDFSGETLDGLRLTDAVLVGTDFSGASMKMVDLSGSDLTRADFTDARLTQATLDDVDLTGASFANADLFGVTSSGVSGVPAALPGGWSVVVGILVGPGSGSTAP